LIENGVGIWNDWPYQNWLRETGQDKNLVMYSAEWRAGMREFTQQIMADQDFADKYGDLGPIW
jgi:thymidylate synthase